MSKVMFIELRGKMFKKPLCHDSYSALIKYLAFGLEPGSFCEELLLNDKTEAYRCAHRLLYPVSLGGSSQGEDIVSNMLEFTNTFPIIARDDHRSVTAWKMHSGYYKASHEAKALFVLLFKTIYFAQDCPQQITVAAQ